MEQRKIIVAGVSSAGKSTFIRKRLAEDPDTKADVLFAGRLVRQFGLTGSDPKPLDLGSSPTAILHYNTLTSWLATDAPMPPVEDDPLVQALCAYADTYTLYLCYAPDAVIRARMARRDSVEPGLGDTSYAYPKQRLGALFDQIDQRQRLLTFATAFRHHDPNPTVVFSNDRRTSLLTWQEFLYAPPTPDLESALSEA